MNLGPETEYVEHEGPAGEPDAACVPVPKPFLSPEGLVASLKARGVTFDLCSEADAADYLHGANNYLRTGSYRKIFDRQIEGPRVGDYVNLDFAHLVDLSSIDRQLRETLLPMAMDVEHFAKLHVHNRAKAEGEDGYAIVSDYIASINHKERSRLVGSLRARAKEETHDEYSGDLIAHHIDRLPVWVFLEVMELGWFVDFYRFCAERWGDAAMLQEHYVLKSVKALRNACAHGACIANGFTSNVGRSVTSIPHSLVTEALNAGGLPNSKSRRAKLGNLRVSQMASLLWCFSRYCARERTIQRNAERMRALKARVLESAPLYAKYDEIVSYFDFLWKLVDALGPGLA